MTALRPSGQGSLINTKRQVRLWPLVLLVLTLGLPNLGVSQQNATSDADEQTITGRVASSTRNTMVVRTENGRYQLLVFDRDTVKPATLATGSSVRVSSVAGGEQGTRLARTVTVLSAASPAAGGGTSPADNDALPATIRRLERDIERSARRYGLGVRAGAALDPELLLVGVHANLGSVFTRNVSLRPNVEFAFGEVTNLFAINLEALYRLPFTPRGGRWSAYLGGGPGFLFVDQNFERAAQGDRDIDFNDFDFNAGLNILTGVEFRNGMFLEAKTTVYAQPHLRFIVGYSF